MKSLPWASFNTVSNSHAARATVLIPLIGYMIIFNESVVKYLNLVGELGGAQRVFGVSPRLLLIYFGLCAIAGGVTLYSIYCPGGVKHYGSTNAYVGGVQDSIKGYALEAIEGTLRGSPFAGQYMRIRDRYDAPTVAQVTRVTSETEANVKNAILHVYYSHLNWSHPWVRTMVGILYLIGFVCLAIPSLGVFVRVLTVLWAVMTTNFGSLF